MSVDLLPALRPARVAWSKGRIVGQKRPLLPRHVWSIRVRLEMAGNARDLALFNIVNRRAKLAPFRRPKLPPLATSRSGPEPTELITGWRRVRP